MNCPQCKVTLTISERKNIEIDYCPQCRGIWLDRGELDKLLEASSRDSERSNDQDKNFPHGHKSEHREYKRKSFLKEIFDF